jgi:tetratricopeptide (TPR) repeat protein
MMNDQQLKNTTEIIELAQNYHQQGDTHRAIELLTQATSAQPELDGNWLLLGEYLAQVNDQQASDNAFMQYEMIKAFNDNLSLAEQAFLTSDYVKSDQICRGLLQQVPKEIRVMRLLAKIAKHFRHFEISASILASCAETKPDDVAIGVEYANALLASNMHGKALEECERLLKLAPQDLDIYEIKAATLTKLGRFDEAIAIYRKLVIEHEQQALCLLRLGDVLKIVGEADEAIECYKKAIALEPLSGEAWWNLANLKTYAFTEHDLELMQRVKDNTNITDLNKTLIHFALGKALEDQQQFTESFQHYKIANDNYIRNRPYQHISQNEKYKNFFTSAYFEDKRGPGHSSTAPIFVVGLPRSGSTLVEQILASHSLIDGTMELTEIVSIARELNNHDPSGQSQFLDSLANLTEAQVKGFAQRYLDYVQPLRQKAPYFIDKTPGNFHHIGLIKTLFPAAKIIDVRRSPMASGWSVYKQFFAEGHRFSYDLATIGQYYNEYIELMDHWQRALPDQILTINYEDLVNDLPGTTAIILDYCGLEFEENCLDYHKTNRAIATPSSEQVRQPIYSTALNQWKNYEQFLTPLKQR